VQPAVTAASSKNPTQISCFSRILFGFVAVLALAGVVVSAVSLQRHYAKSETQFCDLGQKFNCDIVNRSEHSEIMGIPVAGIGIAGYAVLFVLGTFQCDRGTTPNRLLVASLAGLVFALYLTYIEAHVLETWCILCLISLALISLITTAAVAIKITSARA